MDELIATAGGLVGEFELSNKWTAAGAVGAALITDKGNIYTGINVDLQCGIGFCAEHSAVAAMLKKRETRIEMIVAVTSEGVVPPCGRCREMLIQLNANNSETKVIVDAKNWMPSSELLPNHWL